ncbi:MAG: ABC transporter permease, partial [Elusimicrobiota bacterium]
LADKIINLDTKEVKIQNPHNMGKIRSQQIYEDKKISYKFFGKECFRNLKNHFSHYFLLSLICSLAFSAYFIFVNQYTKFSAALEKRLKEKTLYYVVEGNIDLKDFITKIKVSKSIKKLYPYLNFQIKSNYFNEQIDIYAFDYNFISMNKLRLICGDFPVNSDSVLVGIQLAKKANSNPCLILGENIDISGKKFKVTGIFKKSKNKYVNVSDDSLIISFNPSEISNLGQKYISGFVAEVYIDKASNFKYDISNLLTVKSLRQPFCRSTTSEIKHKKEIFENLKSKTWFYFLIAFVLLVIMNFIREKNRFFFMFLNGFSKIEIMFIEFFPLFFVFPAFVLISFILNFILKYFWGLPDLNVFFSNLFSFSFKCLLIWLFTMYIMLTGFYLKRE